MKTSCMNKGTITTQQSKPLIIIKYYYLINNGIATIGQLISEYENFYTFCESYRTLKITYAKLHAQSTMDSSCSYIIPDHLSQT